jgi:NAD(P)-dependent dehydrogenase (short-subunit alcohol dehydrogenase family)
VIFPKGRGVSPAPPSNLSTIYQGLSHRSVFVSGGGSGIGAAFVAHFAAQGARVAFADIADVPSQLLAAQCGEDRVRYLRCDIRDIAALQAALAAARQAFGPVTVLINNAARDDRHKLADVTAAAWDENMAVNLRHHFFAAQAVAPGMAAAGGGAIINLGSVAWLRARPDLVMYSTAKAAISGMTRVLARELGHHNIRVNAILPGAVATERQRALWATPADEERYLAAQCLKFRVSVDDIAHTALFLASDEARAITGQSIVVDAGLAQAGFLA